LSVNHNNAAKQLLRNILTQLYLTTDGRYELTRPESTQEGKPVMNRRELLKAFTALGAVQATGSAIAKNSLGLTSVDIEGPFYPVEPIPLEQSLITGPGFVGQELFFGGQVLSATGKPLSDIRVEIWQCDGNGIYHHPRAPEPSKRDPQFSGFSAQITDNEGAYEFRTLVPVPYPGRPPHIHVKLWMGQEELLTTQIYLEGQGGAASRKIALQAVSADSADRGQYQADFNFVLNV